MGCDDRRLRGCSRWWGRSGWCAGRRRSTSRIANAVVEPRQQFTYDARSTTPTDQRVPGRGPDDRGQREALPPVLVPRCSGIGAQVRRNACPGAPESVPRSGWNGRPDRSGTRNREYRSELVDVLRRLKLGPRDVLRKADASKLGLRGDESDELLIGLMAENPTLLQRPIGVVGKRAVLGRPPEALLGLVGGDRGGWAALGRTSSRASFPVWAAAVPGSRLRYSSKARGRRSVFTRVDRLWSRDACRHSALCSMIPRWVPPTPRPSFPTGHQAREPREDGGPTQWCDRVACVSEPWLAVLCSPRPIALICAPHRHI